MVRQERLELQSSIPKFSGSLLAPLVLSKVMNGESNLIEKMH